MRRASKDNKDICIKNEFGFVPWNCLHLFFLKGAAAALVLTAALEVYRGNLAFSMMLMASMFSFTIFSGVESINDAAHVLSVIDSAMDRLEDIQRRSPSIRTDGI